MTTSLVQQCLDILQKDEIKNEVKMFLKPIIDIILSELSPYIYLIIGTVFVFFSFILMIFILLLLLVKEKYLHLKVLFSNQNV